MISLKHTSGELLIDLRIKTKSAVKVLIAVCLLIAVISGAALFRLRQMTPYEYLQYHYRDVNSSDFYPLELIYQTTAKSANDEEVILVFHKTNYGISVGILKNSLLSFKVEDYCGSLSFKEGHDDSSGYSGNYMCTVYNHEKYELPDNFFFGINKDKSVEKVIVDGEESECADLGDFKIFWKFSHCTDEPPFEEIKRQTAK